MQHSSPNQLPRLVDSPSTIKSTNELVTVSLFFLALITVFNALTIPFALESGELNTSASGITYGAILFIEFFLTPSLWYIISKPRNQIYWLPLTLLWFAVTWRFNLSQVDFSGVFDFFANPFGYLLFPLALFHYISLIGSFLSTFLLSVSCLRDRRMAQPQRQLADVAKSTLKVTG